MYYVPAPARKSALVRDWIVMAFCRPFFPEIVYHWHAAGMGNWLVNDATPLVRAITRWLCGNASLSIVLSNYNKADAEALNPKRILMVPNGIPDPCPEFEPVVLQRRRARVAARRKRMEGRPLDVDEVAAAGNDFDTAHVLFLANCSREKGLFDTIEGVRLANERLERLNAPLRFKLRVVGGFMDEKQRVEFEAIRQDIEVQKWLKFDGFLSGEEKRRAFLDADVFCFPSFHHAENLSLVLLEAMSFGLPIVTTRWRSLPEILSPGSSSLVDPRNPAQVSGGLLNLLTVDSARDTREWFLQHFTLERHLSSLAEAIKSTARTNGDQQHRLATASDPQSPES
jgi:glycosyltransferase involved in cell wall biosynthesis